MEKQEKVTLWFETGRKAYGHSGDGGIGSYELPDCIFMSEKRDDECDDRWPKEFDGKLDLERHLADCSRYIRQIHPGAEVCFGIPARFCTGRMESGGQIMRVSGIGRAWTKGSPQSVPVEYLALVRKYFPEAV